MRHAPRIRPQILVIAVALVIAACGSDGGSTTTGADTTSPSTTTPSTTTTVPTTGTTATTTTTAATTTTTAGGMAGHVVYLLMEEVDGDGGPFLVPVYRESEGDDLATTLDLLMEGPTEAEVEGTPSLSSSIPDGVEVLDASITDGVATIDLSSEFEDGGGSASMFSRLAQLVFTATRGDADEVVLFIDGQQVEEFSSEGIILEQPMVRTDWYDDHLPPIFVDRPAWGEPVTSPVQVTGVSNVFEATSQVMLTDDDGLPLFEDVVTATCGTGCWGTWEVEIPYTIDRDQFGALIVWEFSAKDGSRINIREQPVQLIGPA